MASEAEIGDDVIRQAMAGFSGVKRRFQLTGTWNGVAIYDDYGHHPVEIAAVLKAAKAGARGRVIAVVEPHRYTRVRDLFEEFAACFKDADSVIVTPLYSAGELPIEGIDHNSLAEAIRGDGPWRRRHGRQRARDRCGAQELRHVRRHRRLPGRRQQHRMGARAARSGWPASPSAPGAPHDSIANLRLPLRRRLAFDATRGGRCVRDLDRPSPTLKHMQRPIQVAGRIGWG